MNSLNLKTCGSAIVAIHRSHEGVRILLLRRNEPPEGAWCYVAGNIEEGENAHEAAVRELREETGLEVEELYSSDRCEQFYEIHNNAIWIAPVFVGFVTTDKVRLDSEHSAYRWCTIEETLERLTFPGARDIMKSIVDHFIINRPLAYLKIGPPATLR